MRSSRRQSRRIALALALTVLSSATYATSIMQGQQVSCPRACLAEGAATPPVSGWTIEFLSKLNGKGKEDCEPCRKCTATLHASYTGGGFQTYTVMTWDESTGTYVEGGFGSLDPESGEAFIPLQTACDEVPDLYVFSGGGGTAALNCGCQGGGA